MITTTELAKAFINSHYGWAVADQFEDTFEREEPFEEMNRNALNYINDAIGVLISSGLLHKRCEIELESYQEKLSNYLETDPTPIGEDED